MRPPSENLAFAWFSRLAKLCVQTVISTRIQTFLVCLGRIRRPDFRPVQCRITAGRHRRRGRRTLGINPQLTYMSTHLDNLLRRGELSRWEPELGPRRLPQRRLFVTAEFAAWAQSLPDQLATSQRLVAPAAELNEIAASFVAGDKLISFIRKIDPPRAQGLMRLNTTSFRLAGWCPAPQALVLAQGATADATHGGGVRLSDLGKEVVRIRRKLGFTTWETGEIYELFRAED